MKKGIVIAGIAALLAFFFLSRKTSASQTGTTGSPGTLEDTSQALASLSGVSQVASPAGVQAQAQISSILSKVSDAYSAFAAMDPSAASQVAQAQAQIAAGTATAEDIVLFNSQIKAYTTYKAGGGTLDFNKFTGYLSSQSLAAQAGIPADVYAIFDTGKSSVIAMQASNLIGSLSPAGLTEQLNNASPELVAAIKAQIPGYDKDPAAAVAAVEAARVATNYGVPAADAVAFYAMNAPEKQAYLWAHGL